MNVGELKKALEEYPDNMQVFLDERVTDDFTFGLLNGVRKNKIGFSEDPDEDAMSHEDVIILSEE